MTRFALRSLGVAVGLVLVAQVPLAYAEADTLRMAGLSKPVEIIRDRWGIPHIYARNEADLFFAQGYNAARDRLFQFEIWRRQATGTTAEILGRKELKRDIGARLHSFRGDMKREMAHYHPRGELIITSFVRGVNAYIEETERKPSLLPLEFRLLGIRPGRWTPEVVISRHQGLLGNIGEELATGRAVARLGPKKVQELSFFQPANPKLELDPAINPLLLAADILELYTAFRAPLRFEPKDIVAAYRGDEATFRQLAAAMPAELELDRGGEAIGSNNWVVSGRLTASGFPIMANDPHRAQQAPSLRYYAHLVAPGWNVIGGGEPVLPGISIGHNEYGAWGLTIFSVDGEDLYVYDTNPANPSQYRYRGRWEAMRVIRETIPVKGEPPVTAELKYTRHGPVLYEDRKHNKAYALRAAWMEIGGAPYLASLRMDQAKTWEQFRDASRYSHIPGENMVWADVRGNIGWQAVGISPIRPNWSGLVPVPGDGRYEWAGYLAIKQLPHVLNPPKGFWGTANNHLLPPGYPHRNAVGYSWADPFRFLRVEEFLASGRRHTVMDMMRLQHDELSIPARTLVPLLAGVRPEDPRVRQAIEQLLQWDHVLDKNSVPAGIYVAWERRLQQNVYNLFVPPTARDVIPRTALTKVIAWLLAPDGHFGKDPLAGRDA
ncbi:MAG: penicillin acylase family protein, partial [Gemmatimonadota bacterium]|nr:penicillin acylase family protein [Gemmatimonadota bacterium]